MVRLIALLAVCLLAAGCTNLPEEPPPTSWTPQQQLTPQAGPKPELPGEFTPAPGQRQPGQTQQSVPPPQGCKDFDAMVIATCLSPVSGVAMIGADSQGTVTAYATERTTGRLLKVARNVDPVVIATIPVDASSDGGLSGLALSATFAEDQLVYVYVTTPTDNRVLRLAPGDQPKPILTGIPRGPSGNRGVLASDRKGALLVATGDAGNPALAADPNSLAGKVLRIDGQGNPAQGNPTAGSRVLTSGLRLPGGLCVSADTTKVWVTDWTPAADVLYRIEAGKALGNPAWTWPDKPGIAGCSAQSNMMSAAMSKSPGVVQLPMGPDGSFTGKPEIIMADTGYGMLGPMEMLNDEASLVGTVNKTGGKTVSSDDRVAIIVRTSNPSAQKD
ncbi:glucose dehydrogenase [Lentzea sp. NBRC 105346]|uniref:PQQ-dependent sugar dehydrogenase n=1 Tax=Lentzea sp. NBRC 105346 TaxID=3032205 RepID=UPI0024A051B9|nr:PQQ-dependent sugar dehydrogenase [Lentzea sp. NBRC 105346]GLZ35450.1 glucose dehydrogenase [Lentzea sp. NBRC 105346]